MNDDYQSTIASLVTARDTIVADLEGTAAQLAAMAIVPQFSESGDGGSESIDVPGMRRELMDEIAAKTAQIKELSITISSLSAGINIKRIHRRPFCRWPL